MKMSTNILRISAPVELITNVKKGFKKKLIELNSLKNSNKDPKEQFIHFKDENSKLKEETEKSNKISTTIKSVDTIVIFWNFYFCCTTFYRIRIVANTIFNESSIGFVFK